MLELVCKACGRRVDTGIEPVAGDRYACPFCGTKYAAEVLSERFPLEATEREKLGEILKKSCLVDTTKINHALEIQKKRPDKKVGELLIELGYVQPDQVVDALKRQSSSAIGMILADYLLEKQLGKGAYGAVYKAVNVSSSGTYALKILDPKHLSDETAVKLFRREAEIGSRLVHPNIVKSYGMMKEGNLGFIVMEYVPSVDLNALLVARGNDLPWKESCKIAKQVAEGLRYAWDEFRIVHRDIKPRNLLVCEDGTVKITDFGLAKPLGAVIGESTATADGTFLGTYFWASPEQFIAKKGTISHPSDIYSLGAVLYQCLTGRVPFTGETVYEIADGHVRRPPIPPRDLKKSIPPDVEAITLKCLQKKPTERYPHAGALAAALDAAIAPQKSYFHFLAARLEARKTRRTLAKLSKSSGPASAPDTRFIRQMASKKIAKYAAAFLLPLLAATAVLAWYLATEWNKIKIRNTAAALVDHGFLEAALAVLEKHKDQYPAGTFEQDVHDYSKKRDLARAALSEARDLLKNEEFDEARARVAEAANWKDPPCGYAFCLPHEIEIKKEIHVVEMHRRRANFEISLKKAKALVENLPKTPKSAPTPQYLETARGKLEISYPGIYQELVARVNRCMEEWNVWRTQMENQLADLVRKVEAIQARWSSLRKEASSAWGKMDFEKACDTYKSMLAEDCTPECREILHLKVACEQSKSKFVSYQKAEATGDEVAQYNAGQDIWRLAWENDITIPALRDVLEALGERSKVVTDMESRVASARFSLQNKRLAEARNILELFLAETLLFEGKKGRIPKLREETRTILSKEVYPLLIPQDYNSAFVSTDVKDAMSLLDNVETNTRRLRELDPNNELVRKYETRVKGTRHHLRVLLEQKARLTTLTSRNEKLKCYELLRSTADAIRKADPEAPIESLIEEWKTQHEQLLEEQTLENHAREAYTAGDYATCLACCEKLLSLCPGDAYALTTREKCVELLRLSEEAAEYIAKNKTQAAIETYRKMQNIEPNDPISRNGIRKLRDNVMEEAKALWDKKAESIENVERILTILKPLEPDLSAGSPAKQLYEDCIKLHQLYKQALQARDQLNLEEARLLCMQLLRQVPGQRQVSELKTKIDELLKEQPKISRIVPDNKKVIALPFGKSVTFSIEATSGNPVALVATWKVDNEALPGKTGVPLDGRRSSFELNHKDQEETGKRKRVSVEIVSPAGLTANVEWLVALHPPETVSSIDDEDIVIAAPKLMKEFAENYQKGDAAAIVSRFTDELRKAQAAKWKEGLAREAKANITVELISPPEVKMSEGTNIIQCRFRIITSVRGRKKVDESKYEFHCVWNSEKSMWFYEKLELLDK